MTDEHQALTPPPFSRNPAADVLLSVEDLRTHFFTRDGAIPAVDGVDFVVRRGEVLGIVGESGSGKSVTARSIMRLVPRPGRIVDGAIWFGDQNLAHATNREMRRIRGARISLVLQEPMSSLNPVLTIGDQVSELYRHHPERAPAREGILGAVVSILGQVRIPDAARRLSEYPMHFSGGMRQRVSIAMAAACRPDIVILDEPTTALDVTIQAQVLELLLDLREQFGMSLIIITHDLGVVAQVCDTVAVMYAGKIVEYADIESIFDNPQHPYTQSLLRSVPAVDRRRHRLASITGQPPDLFHLPAGCSFAPRCPIADERCHEEEPAATPLRRNGSPGGYIRCWAAEEGRSILPPIAYEEVS